MLSRHNYVLLFRNQGWSDTTTHRDVLLNIFKFDFVPKFLNLIKCPKTALRKKMFPLNLRGMFPPYNVDTYAIVRQNTYFEETAFLVSFSDSLWK